MVPSRFSLSGTALKRLALVSMLLDHLGASLLEAGRFTTAVPPAETLLRLDRCLRWAGRLVRGSTTAQPALGALGRVAGARVDDGAAPGPSVARLRAPGCALRTMRRR